MAMFDKRRTSQIAYIDSTMMGYGSREGLNPDEDDNRTPIEKWLDRVTRNLDVVRKNYYGDRKPKYMHQMKVKISKSSVSKRESVPLPPLMNLQPT